MLMRNGGQRLRQLPPGASGAALRPHRFLAQLLPPRLTTQTGLQPGARRLQLPLQGRRLVVAESGRRPRRRHRHGHAARTAVVTRRRTVRTTQLWNFVQRLKTGRRRRGRNLLLDVPGQITQTVQQIGGLRQELSDRLLLLLLLSDLGDVADAAAPRRPATTGRTAAEGVAPTTFGLGTGTAVLVRARVMLGQSGRRAAAFSERSVQILQIEPHAVAPDVG